jgi:thioredoxin 1
MRRRLTCFVLLVLVALFAVSCSNRSSADKSGTAGKVADNGTAKITFLELGSVTCIPCKKMQPVMKSIESRYAGLVKVVFHDVMKEKSFVDQYGIKLIPTQVFLDATGKELMRHEGFFPEEEIDKFLKTQGVSPAL